MTPFENDRLLTTKETAAMLNLSPGTLNKARIYGTPGFPPFVKIGKACRYKLSTVSEFIADQKELSHTSQQQVQ